MYIQRQLSENIKKQIVSQFSQVKKQIIILYGPRQVGKTTLIQTIVEQIDAKSSYYSCDLVEIREILTDPKLINLQRFVSDNKIIILDEAQRVPNIGLTLKILYENFPDCQFIATGSSSFDLSNSIKEPLTGRKIELLLLPFSWNELNAHFGFVTMQGQLKNSLKYGHYPLVFNSKIDELESNLNLLTKDYLFKDVLIFDKLPNTTNLQKLLTALAYQIGSEVSTNKLANMLDLGRTTIDRYLEILERAFIIFKLPALAKNHYNEISKTKKYYFYDIGIRNSLIRNFGDLETRSDIGALWENFCVLERLKSNLYSYYQPNSYFWRTHNQSEIDYVEEQNGIYQAFEFKWNKAKIRQSDIFLQNYKTKNNQIELVNNQNFWEFLEK